MIIAGAAETVIAVRNTHDVRLAQLVVSGGEYGVLVEQSRAVRILGSWIRDAGFVGIRISRSSALIQGNEVRAGTGAYGMGIELANTMSQAHSTIRNNVVSGSTSARQLLISCDGGGSNGYRVLSGSTSSPGSRARAASRSRSATCPPARASGTRSSTASSRTAA